ncbi:MAG: acyl-CoA thioester hydrolase/BAAT C-terminal domain-containing protein [Comamonas sp.]
MPGQPQPHTATAGPRLRVAPPDALIDVPRRIVATGLVPGETVRIESATPRGQGAVWRSQASFRADAQGTLDLGRDAPLAGGYAGADAMGLIWSQAPEPASAREVFADEPAAALTTQLTLHARHGSAHASLRQQLAAEGVTRRAVREDGLVGTLFLPAGAGPHPAVIVLNGSGGGINEPRAALYASRGYAAFALAYFKAPGLSNYISNTPLEYFKAGLDWVRREVRPAHGFVALSGQSRGGELVLLLATLYPRDVSAVLAYVPGAVVHGGQAAADPAIGRDGPAWLLGGQPLPHVWQDNKTATWAPYDDGPPPHRNERAIRTALRDPDAVARARIPVEKIRAPVLLLSASDDGAWPSSLYTTMVADTLAAAGHPYPVQRLDFEGAGHSVLFPYVPTSQLFYTHPVSGRASSVGGSPAANAHANTASWQAARDFLAQAVRMHGPAA